MQAKTYLPHEAAEITGANLNTLRDWMRPDSGLPILHEDDRGRGAGHASRFDEHRVMMLAIMVDLVRHGVPAKRAADAALVFCYTGVDNFDATDKAPTRQPGNLFATGKTILAVRPSKMFGDVVNINDTEPFFAAWSAIAGGESGVVALNLNETVARVKQRLGLE